LPICRNWCWNSTRRWRLSKEANNVSILNPHPRPLIQAIVQVMKPDPRGKPDFRICDPACGTGGFLVCSYEWLVSKEVSGGVFDRADARRIKSQTFIGQK
jgi:type I restriction-modification system DNA methylase subunit